MRHCILRPAHLSTLALLLPLMLVAANAIGCKGKPEPVAKEAKRFRPADDVVAQFLASLLNSTVGHRAIRKITIEGTRARVSLTEFKSLSFPKPMRKEQELIAERISAIQRGSGAFVSELEKLKLQKHGLMHDLLTGRVRVKVDGG